MTPADVVLELLHSMVSWLGGALPRLPSSWVALVNGLVADAAELVSGVPYSGLLPWGVISAVAIGLPVVMASAFVLRMLMRVWAWVRSRGTADT